MDRQSGKARARLRGAAGWLAFVVLGLAACGRSERAEHAAFVAAAQAEVLAKAGAGASIIAMGADGTRGQACGWLDLGAPEGVASFQATRGAEGDRYYVDIHHALRGEPQDIAQQLYYRALANQLCSGLLPPAPPGAQVDANEREVGRLWEKDGPAWAFVDTTGQGRVLGIKRRKGGGMIITPTFASLEPLQAWLGAVGGALAEQEQQAGIAAMDRVEACYDQARAQRKTVMCSDPGLDQVVVLPASR